LGLLYSNNVLLELEFSNRRRRWRKRRKRRRREKALIYI
jgi:hypothetical protein